MDYKEAFFKIVISIFTNADAGLGDYNWIGLLNKTYELLEKIDDRNDIAQLAIILGLLETEKIDSGLTKPIKDIIIRKLEILKKT